MGVPSCCPQCGERNDWHEMPNILRYIHIGGILGCFLKPRAVYHCEKCGFYGKYRKNTDPPYLWTKKRGSD